MKPRTKDIYCPICGACKGADCRNLNHYSYMIDRPHQERVVAARAIRQFKQGLWYL